MLEQSSGNVFTLERLYRVVGIVDVVFLYWNGAIGTMDVVFLSWNRASCSSQDLEVEYPIVLGITIWWRYGVVVVT